MPRSLTIVQVAVPAPLRHTFDYLSPKGGDSVSLVRGVRVKVPFGSSTTVGVVMAVVQGSRIASHRLKPVLSILDKEPLFSADQLDLLQWASSYYQHPIGEVIASALPAPLRRGRPAQVRVRREL